jgi:hypothetical protein
MTLADLVSESLAQEQKSSSRFIALSNIRVVSDLGFALPSKNSEPEVRPLS